MTPSTDLVDGQEVMVTGSGFSLDVSTVGIVECSAPNDCSSQVEVPAVLGELIATVVVTRFDLGTDCALAPGTCIIAVANLDGGAGPFTEVATAPLSFTTSTTTPGAPTIGSATAGHQQATVSWSAPVSDGGSPIVGYVVTPYVGLVSHGPRYFVSTATTQTITGLTNGTTYRFRVRAWNASGVGGFSATSNAVTPAPTTPSAPSIGSAVAGDGEATVSWGAPVSDGGSSIVGYVVTPYVGLVSQGPRYFVSTATTQTITGLTNGTTYRFRVRAWNAVGVSAFSNTTNQVTPAG